MRVIQCASYGGPYRGSFVPMLEAITAEAAGRGHGSTIVLWDSVRDRRWVADLAGVADLRFVSTRGGRTRALADTARQLHRALGAGGGPAVLHTHFASFDIPAALLRRGRRRTAVLWHEHGPLYSDRYHRVRNTARYASVGRLVDGILCVSDELAAELRARHAPPDRLHVFQNAIDTRVFSPATAAERTTARAALGIPESARVVLHFGWEWTIKGGDLMTAAADLVSDDPDVLFLTVLGAAVDPAVVQGHGNVRSIAPADEVRQLYAASDVFLGCSRFEGALPLAALEALACGLPLVVTDIPVQARFARPLPGAAVVAADPPAVAAGIRRMLSLTEAQRAANLVVARERLGASFSLEDWARRLVDLYEGTVDTR